MIRITTLTNGIRVITDSSETAESVSLGVWVGVGSRYETQKNNGISHVLEHMAFKGTTTRNAYQISAAIEDLGGILNAYTSRDVTAYYVRILKQHLKTGIEIIADILQNSTMDDAELQKEKGVIIQEIKMGNDTPNELVFDHFTETAYPNQPLGRSIAGTEEIVSAITSKELLDYMHKHYRGDNMFISASGAVKHKEFAELCEKLFSGILRKSTVSPLKARYVGGEKRTLKPHEQVNMILGFKGCSYNDKNYYAAKVLSAILSGGMSSRLPQEIREKRGLVYSIYTSNWAHKDTGVFYVYAGTGEKEIQELLPVLCDELLNIENLKAVELAHAKTQIKSHVLMRAENIATHAEMNGLNMLTYGRIISKSEVVKKISSVQKEDVLKTAKEIFSSTPTFAALGPIKKVPDYDKITELLKK